MADSANTSSTNGHTAPKPSTASSMSASSSHSPLDVRVLVVTPIVPIVKELQSRLSTLPAGVRVEIADTLSERHVEEQIANCHVIFGEPKEIHDKLHVRHVVAHTAASTHCNQHTRDTSAHARCDSLCCTVLCYDVFDSPVGVEAAVDPTCDGWHRQSTQLRRRAQHAIPGHSSRRRLIRTAVRQYNMTTAQHTRSPAAARRLAHSSSTRRELLLTQSLLWLLLSPARLCSMSEFVLCHILARERHLYEWDIAQKEHRWKTSDPSIGYRTLDNLTVAIMGCTGSIGMHIARTCHFFKMNVKGLASKKHSSHSHSHNQPASSHHSHASSHTQPPIEWYYTEPPTSPGGPSTIPPAFFHDVDYIVNVLPSTASTRDMLTADVLQHCRRHAADSPRTVFINMGRGDIISEQALLRALLGSHSNSLLASPHGHLPVPGVDAYLAGAILDVFITEPLPSEHVFYTLSPPLLTISPHVSGMSAAAKVQIVDLFVDNLQRFIQMQPLLYEVDKQKGY